MLRLRSAILGVVWLANAGAVLSMPDGPQGCDPAYCVVWFRFRMVRLYLARRPSKVGRVYRLLDMVREGFPVHGPVHLFVAGAAGIRFHSTCLAGCALGSWV